jgi:hypothetical protein
VAGARHARSDCVSASEQGSGQIQRAGDLIWKLWFLFVHEYSLHGRPRRERHTAVLPAHVVPLQVILFNSLTWDIARNRINHAHRFRRSYSFAYSYTRSIAGNMWLWFYLVAAKIPTESIASIILLFLTRESEQRWKHRNIPQLGHSFTCPFCIILHDIDSEKRVGFTRLILNL